MSSFKDNFGRGSEENLQYDDTAFYFFAVAMLVSLSVVIFIFLLRKLTAKKGAEKNWK